MSLSSELKSISNLLATSDIFGGLDQSTIDVIADDCVKRKFAAQETIFFKGDPSDGFHIIQAGEVRLSVLSSDGRELTFEIANPGEIFGEIGAIDGKLRSANAVALSQVETIFLATNKLEQLNIEHPGLGQHLMTFLCNRIRKVSDHFEDIALYTLDVRMARFLLNEAASNESSQFRLRMTQGELSMLLGASRQRVNMALVELETQGALQRDGSLFICDLEVLEAIGSLS